MVSADRRHNARAREPVLAVGATAARRHDAASPGDAGAAKAFQAYSLAYEVLRQGEERRTWSG